MYIANKQYHVIKQNRTNNNMSSVPLWPSGASALDPEMCGRYKLSVMVRDMAGKADAFFTSGIVTVEVTGNTWASPDPVRLQENLPGPYPIPISQVRQYRRRTHKVRTKGDVMYFFSFFFSFLQCIIKFLAHVKDLKSLKAQSLQHSLQNALSV